MNIAINSALPYFPFTATSGLSDTNTSLQKGTVVLYFYPRDDTPGCTQEGSDFTALYDQFQAVDCRVFGISRDTLTSHEKFKAKMAFPFELIADPEEHICNLFGVMREKNMYGKKVRGIDRSSFVVRNNVLVQEWRSVKVAGHAQIVLTFVQSLIGG